MKRRRFVLFLLLLSWSGAQDLSGLAASISSQSEIARLIATATDEVLLAVPTLLSPTLAEALREAVVVRGVRIFLLVSADHAEDRASYVMSLRLAGAEVRLAEVAESYLVVDRRHMVSGPLLAALEGAQVFEKTAQSRDGDDMSRVIAWFYVAFRASLSYEPTISNLGENDEP